MLTSEQLKATYAQISATLNALAKSYNFQIAPKQPLGRPAASGDGSREFRLQLINTQMNTADTLKTNLLTNLTKIPGVEGVTFNPISPNSSKYPSISFTWKYLYPVKFDVVIAKGANKGENFEKKVVTDLQNYFSQSNIKDSYSVLIEKLSKANPEFKFNELASVSQRKGSTLKENVAIEKLGAVIGDIVITDTNKKEWYISLKDVNGDTFSSYSGAASLFNVSGDLQDGSAGAQFLLSFGANLNQVQDGFDKRQKKQANRRAYKKEDANQQKIKSIFERAWGMNYFYVRRQTQGWKVFWIDSAMLNKLTSNIVVSNIKYPSETSKQITIQCGNDYASYTIEVRNSKGGEYPNDIKFKAGTLKI